MHWSGFLLPAVGPQGSPAGLKAQGSGTDHGPHTMSNCEPLVTAPAVPTLSVQIGCQAGDAPIDEPPLARRKAALMPSPGKEVAVAVGTLLEGRAWKLLGVLRLTVVLPLLLAQIWLESREIS